MVDERETPRWAKEFEAAVWDRVNELLMDGWDTNDIMRELAIPQSKLSSLQKHARKFGPRRRLGLFEKFKDSLLAAGAEMGPDFAKAMTVVAAHAVSPDVKTSTQEKSVELMIEFAKLVTKLAAIEVKADADAREAGERDTTNEALPDEAIVQIKQIYGVAGDSDGS